MNKLAPLFVIIVLCSCGVKVEHGFMPPKDSLVREYFDKEIIELGISYTVDEEGYYKSTKQNVEVMSGIEARAYEKSRENSSLIIESSCSLNKIKKYLSENNAVFAIYREAEETRLKTNSTLFNTLKIMEHYALYKHQCENI